MLGEPLEPGLVLGARFELVARVGVGGMGVVYRARDLETDDPVALKMRRGAIDDVARFEREAAILEGLDHPGIVRYVSHGVDARGAYLVMEWLEGRDREALRSPGARGTS